MFCFHLQLTFILKWRLGAGSIEFLATHSYSEWLCRLTSCSLRCGPVAISFEFLYQNIEGKGLPSASHDNVIFCFSGVFITIWCEPLFSVNTGGTPTLRWMERFMPFVRRQLYSPSFFELTGSVFLRNNYYLLSFYLVF